MAYVEVKIKIQFPVVYDQVYLPIPWCFFKLLFDLEKLAKELDVESCIKIKCDHCDSK